MLDLFRLRKVGALGPRPPLAAQWGDLLAQLYRTAPPRRVADVAALREATDGGKRERSRPL